MNGQFFCRQVDKLVPCEKDLIGKTIECPLCGEAHEVVPEKEQTNQLLIGKSETTEPDTDSSTAQPSAIPNRRLSKGGLITTVILAFLGVIAWSSGSGTNATSFVLIAIVFLIRSFYPPFRWWQGIMVFFGVGLLSAVLLEFVNSSEDSTPDLFISILGVGISAALLFLGFRRTVQQPVLNSSFAAIGAKSLNGGHRLAGFWERLLAWLLDLFMLLILSLLVTLFFGLAFPDWAYELKRLPQGVLGFVAIFAVGTLTEVIPTHYFGQSFGKRVLGLQVVSDQADELALLRSTGRYILKYSVSMMLFLGGLWILLNKQRKSWHDLLIKTHVKKLSATDRKTVSWFAFTKSIIRSRVLVYPTAVIGLFVVVSLAAGLGSAGSKWIGRAEKLKRDGKTDAALKEYDKLVETHPSFGLGYAYRGRLFIEHFGDLERAITDFEAAVKLNDGDQVSLLYLAQLYLFKYQLLEESATGQSPAGRRTQPQRASESIKRESSVTELDRFGEKTFTVSPQMQAFRDAAPVSVKVKAAIDLGGKSPAVVKQELREKTKSVILRSLSLNPNNDYLREAIKRLDPSVDLPSKRPCFVVTATSGDANSFEVRTLSEFRDRLLLRNSLGKYAVRLYEKYGPRAARLVVSLGPLKPVVHLVLQYVAVWAWLILKALALIGI